MNRPSFDTIYMQMAELVSQRSTCSRLQVGTVITSTDHRKVLSIGYNGNATGLHNGCESVVPGHCGCIHSEANAIINLDCPRGLEKVVYITHIPCVMCAKMLVNVGGVTTVIFDKPYRLDDSLYQVLSPAGIKWRKHEKN